MYILEEEKMSNFFTKYHLRGFPFDAVIHKFTKQDEGDPHDHPFGFNSYIIKGGYIERQWRRDGSTFDIVRRRGDSFHVYPETIHRITNLLAEECWTMITPEAPVRKSGFYKFEDGKILHRFWDETEFKQIKL